MTKHNFFALLNLIFISTHMAVAYTLDDFKAEVAEKDSSYKAVQYEDEASQINLRKKELPTATRLYSSNKFFDDTRPVMNPSFQGDRTLGYEVSLGLKQQSSFGLNWDLSQHVKRTKIFGVAPGVFPLSDFYDFFPQAQVSIPLWKNFLGKEIRAQTRALSQATQLQRLQALLSKAQKEAEIESIYYQYGIQKNLFELSQKNLVRSEKLYTWIRERRLKNLVDESDEMQAKAARALRKLDFDKNTKDIELITSTFNSYRGGISAEHVDSLKFDFLAPKALENLSQEKRESLIEKLKSTQVEAEKAQNQIQKEGLKPTLELTGMAALQGHDAGFSKSAGDLLESKKNIWSVGINFEMPLDFTLTRKLLKATRLSIKANDAQLERSSIKQELAWMKQREDLQRCAQSIVLLKELEDSQKTRLASEEKKYKNGRGTLFFVLSAEQDYINAQAQKWANELQCRIIEAQTKLYIAESAESEEGKTL